MPVYIKPAYIISCYVFNVFFLWPNTRCLVFHRGPKVGRKLTCTIPKGLINTSRYYLILLATLLIKLHNIQYCAVLQYIFMSVHVSTDPCKDNDNSLNSLCRVEALTRQPLLFGLPESCPTGNEPLCASDGQTYYSECAMTSTGMQKGIKLRKIHSGRCRRQGMWDNQQCAFWPHNQSAPSWRPHVL